MIILVGYHVRLRRGRSFVVKLQGSRLQRSKTGGFMQAKPSDAQGELYSVQLDFLCNESHPLVHLSNIIDWPQFDQAFGKAGIGRIKHDGKVIWIRRISGVSMW